MLLEIVSIDYNTWVRSLRSRIHQTFKNFSSVVKASMKTKILLPPIFTGSIYTLKLRNFNTSLLKKVLCFQEICKLWKFFLFFSFLSSHNKASGKNIPCLCRRNIIIKNLRQRRKSSSLENCLRTRCFSCKVDWIKSWDRKISETFRFFGMNGASGGAREGKLIY